MTEILIVIALIVLILALAIPAFNLITGTRSVDAGENLVSAMLGRARALAMNTNQTVGVAFVRDYRTERSAMAICVPASQRGSAVPESPGLEQYKAWREFEEDRTTPVPYKTGDIVCALVDINGKKGTRMFVCTQDHAANNSRRPPNANSKSDYWGLLNESDLDTLVGVEYQYLPTGVGAQTINDPDPDPAQNALLSSEAGRDRYLRTGLILFGPDGMLLHKQYTIAVPAVIDTDETHLFKMAGLHLRVPNLNTTPVGYDARQYKTISAGTPTHPLVSQLGVVLYEEEQFKSAGGSQADPLVDNAAYNTAGYNELAEEQWLDGNALSLMINRYNGTLVRGE